MCEAAPASQEPQQEMASTHKKMLKSFRAGVAIRIRRFICSYCFDGTFICCGLGLVSTRQTIVTQGSLR